MPVRARPDPADFDQVPTAVQPGATGTATPLAAVVIEGRDVGQRWPISTSGAQRLLIGTSPVCALRLSDPLVSRRHAAIDTVEGRAHLSDLSSTNGTIVNGTQVTGVYLEEGHRVVLGETVLRIEATEAAQAAHLSEATRFGRLVGSSVAMRSLYPLCERLAQTEVPAILEGDTGTGKEVLAEAIHELGPRAGGPYVVFDCTAIPPNLVESELFGHEKGSFTSAVSQRKGVFEQASGGTLLIDEIGDLDLALQPKLLRVVERSEVRRIGGNTTVRVNVRVLAATRRDLDREIEAGRFRDDLFHRLAVARIALPPLRQRLGDVSVLAQHFWKSLGGDRRGPSAEILRRWEQHSWPGNVRELRNAVIRQLALGDLSGANPSRGSTVPPLSSVTATNALSSQDYFARVLEMDQPLPIARREIIDEFERQYVRRLLERCGGDTARAAELASVTRRYLQVLLAKHRG